MTGKDDSGWCICSWAHPFSPERCRWVMLTKLFGEMAGDWAGRTVLGIPRLDRNKRGDVAVSAVGTMETLIMLGLSC